MIETTRKDRVVNKTRASVKPLLDIISKTLTPTIEILALLCSLLIYIYSQWLVNGVSLDVYQGK